MAILDVIEKPFIPPDEKIIWENRREDFLTNLIAIIPPNMVHST